MSGPPLGDDDLGGGGPDAADLIQPRHRGQHHRVRAPASTRARGAVGVDTVGGGDRHQQLLDAGHWPLRSRTDDPQRFSALHLFLV
jgi:hypothetical protein